ncbi:glycoside hydrolase family 20 protein [Hymenobacter profundi]|uniref:beta-N-acetylhexosaminidase n=1 Tax=Hymenobacter profundi TaxID=1982110 RepID=A0ABS6WZZ9_9BACT|nr:family 20 glycosylhydrolase [Hymenobacter profundi]MBW3128338.1 family 20 glycosylhydrolase [Hymenobacter profundi]
MLSSSYRLWILLLLVVLGWVGLLPTSQAQATELPLLPRPVQATTTGQVFTLSRHTALRVGPGLSAGPATRFRQYVRQVSGMVLELKPTKRRTDVLVLQLDSTAVPQSKGYTLTIDQRRVTVTGHDEAGVFYGLQTLSQLVPPGKANRVSLPGCTITDYPRFPYRGMHLDVSRHMFPVDTIKKWLDVLAFYKINTFHWHLTDDQGWRIEIKKYPHLQTVAAYRDETLIGHKRDLPHRFDGQRYGGYYSQEEVRELVRYAAQRHITIIPEIEMPGHASAALAAYPELGCTGGPYHTATFWGVFDDVYCAGNEATFTFLTDVLDEVAALFPGQYLHIGGDECPKTRWRACPKCQRRIQEEHLRDERELQSYFMRRIGRHLATLNKRLLGWDEILEGGLPPAATVMSWTGEQGGIEAARLGHDVVMTPEKQVYFDYFQTLYPTDSLAAGGYTPLQQLYRYEPVPTELTPAQARHVRGVQANVWTEYMPTPGKLEYMVFPRLLALAEIAWSPGGGRNYPAFLQRVRTHNAVLHAQGVAPSRTYDWLTDSLWAGPKGLPMLQLRTTAANGVIRFTTDGSAPTPQSPVYQAPLAIRQSCVVQATVFEGPTQVQPVYRREFTLGLSTGKPVALAYPVAGSYHQGRPLWGLVNGVAGSPRYNEGQWYGFSGTDLVATLDLGDVQQIRTLGTHVLNYHWQKMWPPTALVFAVSTDGVHYREVYRHTQFPANGINPVCATIAPVAGRYVRVTALNQGTIPAGEYGAGGKAWLLVDELYVN